MSRRCGVCSHPDVADINAQIIEGGRSIRGISRIYALSEDALQRHRKNHLPKIEIEAATESRELGHHRKLRVLEKTLFVILTRRLKDEDDGMVLRTHAQLLRHFEFELRLGEVEEIRRELADLTEIIKEREETR